MAKKNQECCTTGSPGAQTCRVESVVTVDERGQMVLPKDIRERAGIKAGDKLAVVTWEKDGKICCLTLMPTAELAILVKGALGPIFSEILPA